MSCKLKHILYVPELRNQLLSVRVLEKMGVMKFFGGKYSRITKGPKLMATGTLRNGLYVMETPLDSLWIPNGDVEMVENLSLWNQRLEKVHEDGILSMVRNGVVKDINLNTNQRIPM